MSMEDYLSIDPSSPTRDDELTDEERQDLWEAEGERQYQADKEEDINSK